MYENIDMQNCTMVGYDKYEDAEKTGNFTEHWDQLLPLSIIYNCILITYTFYRNPICW